MAKLTPVDYDPFASSSSTGPKFTPVDYDPFSASEGTNQGILDAVHGGEYGAASDKAKNMMTFGLIPPAYSSVIAGANKLRDTLTGENQDRGFGDYYDQSMDRFVSKNEEQGNLYPKSSIAGNTVGFLGGLGGGAIKSGANIMEKGAQGFMPALKQLGKEGLNGAAFAGPVTGLNALGYAKGDTESRLSQGAGGLAAGTALGLATPFAVAGAGKALSAVGNSVGYLRNAVGLGNAESIAQQKVLDIAQRSGKNIDEVLAELQTSNKPVGLADLLEEPGARLAGTAYRNSQEGGKFLSDRLNERTAQSGQRLQQDLSETLTNNQNPYTTSQELLGARGSNAKSAYEEAYRQEPVYTKRLKQFLKEPLINDGIKKGIQLQRIEALAEGKPFNSTAYNIVDFTKDGNPIIKVPNTRVLDAGKRGLDAIIEENTDNITGKMTPLGRAVSMLKKSYLEELDNSNPFYKAARAQFSDESDTIGAIRQGQDAANRNKLGSLPPEKILDQTGRLSSPGKRAFSTGVAGQLRQQGPQAVRNMFGRGVNQGEEQLLPNLGAAFKGVGGDFEEFSNRQLQEVAMANTKNKIMGGSPTAEKLADDMNLGGLDMIKSVVQQDVKGFTRALLKTVDRANGFNEKTGAEVAKLLAPLNMAEKMKVIKQLTDANTKTSKDIAKYVSRSRVAKRAVTYSGTQALSGSFRKSSSEANR